MNKVGWTKVPQSWHKTPFEKSRIIPNSFLRSVPVMMNYGFLFTTDPPLSALIRKVLERSDVSDIAAQWPIVCLQIVNSQKTLAHRPGPSWSRTHDSDASQTQKSIHTNTKYNPASKWIKAVPRRGPEHCLAWSQSPPPTPEGFGLVCFCCCWARAPPPPLFVQRNGSLRIKEWKAHINAKSTSEQPICTETHTRFGMKGPEKK